MFWNKFFRLSRGIGNSNHSIPAGERAYAIGDIHGRLDLLDDLLVKIDEDEAGRPPASTTLIFLGDLVDRGPDSRRVVDRLMQLPNNEMQVCFVLGNHDEMLLRAASGDVKATRFLVRNGGKETALSYGISDDEYEAADIQQLTRMLATSVPREHVEFFRTFADFVEIGGYLFVHAGIRPGLALHQQSPADLRWIRTEFLQHRGSHGKRVIHGHSIVVGPEIKPNRIAIDTGAFATGRLTALGLENRDHWFICSRGAPNPRWSVTDN